MSRPPAQPSSPPRPKTDPPPKPKPTKAATTDLTMYSVATLAEMWGCSRVHIYDLIGTGQLATVQLGTGTRAKTRITATAAAAFIARRSSKGRAA
jgi:hypothetical protein